MIITRSWLEEFIDISKISTDEICKTLNSIGLEVDSIEKTTIPSKVVIGKVLERVKHPEADKLSICQVDLGTQQVQIVCGAKNVDAGQFVPVATLGCDLGNNFIIKEAKLRGVESNGMICSATELGLSKINDGILELDDSIGELILGKELKDYPKVNDEIIEIEETKEILTPKSETENININPNQEKNFNASDIGSLVELLIKSINETEETPKTKRVKIVSISNKDELFIPLEIFVKFTKQYDLGSTDKELKELLDKLKKDGLFKYRTSYIEIKGFANAMYNTRKDFVVFDLSSLGITEDEAELKKRNNQHLRNVTISKGNKDE